MFFRGTRLQRMNKDHLHSIWEYILQKPLEKVVVLALESGMSGCSKIQEGYG